MSESIRAFILYVASVRGVLKGLRVTNTWYFILADREIPQICDLKANWT